MWLSLEAGVALVQRVEHETNLLNPFDHSCDGHGAENTSKMGTVNMNKMKTLDGIIKYFFQPVHMKNILKGKVVQSIRALPHTLRPLMRREWRPLPITSGW